MATNNFKPFATGTGANVLLQTEYEALAALAGGFTSGKASSAQINKALRQSTFIAAALAQYVTNKSGQDVLDDGDVTAFITKMAIAFGKDFQALDAGLTSLAALAGGANMLPYYTAADVFAQTSFTAVGRSLVGQSTAAAALSYLAGAPLASPALTGTPTAPTATAGTSTTQLATTAFVTTADNLKANIANPTFTGIPTAPTAVAGTATDQIATMNALLNGMAAFGLGSSSAPLITDLNSPTVTNILRFSGTATNSPIAYAGTLLHIQWNATNATQYAYSQTSIAAGTDRMFTRSCNSSVWGGWVERPSLNSPAFTGTPTAPTPTAGDSSTQVATTAFVTAADNLKAPLASPALTGTPTAPTAATATNTTQIATTAFVKTNISTLAPLVSPTFTGTPAAPTPTAGDSTTKLATTAFVGNAIANATGKLVGIQIITSTGTYTRNPAATFGYVEVLGAGASGGGCPAIASGQAATVSNCGTGGGGGGYAFKYYSTLPATAPVVVGSGGASTIGAGNAGGSSTFNGDITAYGGAAGTYIGGTYSGNITFARGPGGGTATGGDINAAGGCGEKATLSSNGNVVSGEGGGSKFGPGGATVGGGTAAGQNAASPGAGGGGAVVSRSDTSAAAAQYGGAGANGLVIIWEYA